MHLNYRSSAQIAGFKQPRPKLRFVSSMLRIPRVAQFDMVYVILGQWTDCKISQLRTTSNWCVMHLFCVCIPMH